MKKIVLSLLLATGLMAAENSDYVGFTIGNTDYRLKGSSLLDNVDDTHYSFTLGHYYENSRVSATYSYVDGGSDNFDSNYAFSFAYDFILPIVEDTFSLYAGPVIGYSRIKDDNIDLSGIHYGGQAGAIVQIVENLELEAGYQFIMETGSDEGVDADYGKKWYLGANIRF